MQDIDDKYVIMTVKVVPLKIIYYTINSTDC